MTSSRVLTRLAIFAATALTALLGVTPSSAAIAFKPLGDLPGGTANSLAHAISADGTTVVGLSTSANGLSEAFRWTEATGMVGLGDLPGFNFDSRALGVSSDGSVVTGYGTTAPDGFPQGFRWTASEGLVGLGDLPGGLLAGNAYAISSNGAIIVGSGYNSANRVEAMRWTAETGPTGLGFFSGGNSSTALGVSGNGNVVVGKATGANNVATAFRHTAATGMQDLGSLLAGDQSAANAASADGSVVVGFSFVANFGREAFRWTAATGLVSLGDLAGGAVRSEALAVSADGSVVVGTAEGATLGDGAFIWDATNGLRSLRAILTAAGLAKGWNINAATGISADGTKIVGYGTDKNGVQQAWLVDFDAPPPPPPPPATGGLVWTEDLPQTEAFKANSVVRLAYNNGTGVTDIATLTGASNGGWGGVEYANGLLLVPSSATTGTGTRVHHARYSPILVTNIFAYDLDFTPGYVWQVNGGSRQVLKTVASGLLTQTNSVYDRTYTTVRTRNAGRFTNAVQHSGDTVFFSSSTTSPIGLYKLTAELLLDQASVYTVSTLDAPAIYDFEVVGDFIYFGDITNNAIKRVNTDGTGLVTLVSDAMFPNSIEVTADAIYWTELNTKLIRRAALDGSNPTTLFQLDNTPRGIAVVPLSLIDGPAPQAISLTGLTPTYTGALDAPVALTATATSGLPVTLEIVSGPATLSGNSISFTGTGTVLVRATQAGDANYAPTTFDFPVNATPRLAQTITFPELPNLVYTGTPLTFTLTGSASSGLPLVYSIVEGSAIATRDSATNIVTVTGLGTVSIRAFQNGNTTYAPATFITRTFTVTDTAVVNPLASYLEAAGIPANQRGPLDDPDGDGLANLLEFALGLAPGTANPDGAPDVAIADTLLTLTYTRAQTSGVTYEVETTTDLITWTTAGVTQGTPDASNIVTATIPLDVPGRFLRLKVSLAPAP